MRGPSPIEAGLIGGWMRPRLAGQDCLSRSAPRIHAGLPDYHGFGEGLFLLSLFHMIGQLHLGLLFWQGAGVAALCDEAPDVQAI